MTQQEETVFDINKCQTRRTGAIDVFDCLVEEQCIVCGNAMTFGYHYICKHPQKREFVKEHLRDNLNPSLPDLSE
jgi:hypothetical protein